MTATDIIARLPESFEKARASGDLFFFPSTIHKHEELTTEWEIRLCPALQKKPRLPTPNFGPIAVDGAPARSVQDKKEWDFDPFAPPYNPNLYVGDLQYEDNAYAVLLNKYSIVHHHFLLVTKEFRSQTSPLTPPDLVQAYLLLATASRAGKRFFGFYNCGDNSGASQPHKHIQFIPLDDPIGPPVERLARAVTLETLEKPFTIAKLPYANHVFRLPNQLLSHTPDELERTLSRIFLQLLDLVVSTIRHDPEYPSGRPSYNVLLTPEHMHLIPRRYETHTLSGTGEKLSINALGFSGMLLVKSEAELDAVKRETISTILRSVGLCAVDGDDTMC